MFCSKDLSHHRRKIKRSRQDTPTPSHRAIFAQMSIEQINKTFEEWMKISAENKITAKNSWSLSLIDYFTELNYLKDNRNEINFQKASYALDGCVKVYSSRVDSIVYEAEKLLTGLADNTEEEKKETRKKTLSAKTTFLEKNPETLLLKKGELSETDHLFRKKCTFFDENGIKGIGLASLNIKRNGGTCF